MSSQVLKVNDMSIDRYIDQFTAGSLAEVIGGGLTVYDDLADEVYTLLENIYPHLSVAWLLALNQRHGFDTKRFEDKLQARAAAYDEAAAETTGGHYD